MNNQYKCGNIHAYCPGVGQTNWGLTEVQLFYYFSESLIFLSICPIPASFSLQMTFNSIAYANAHATSIDLATK